MIVRSCVCFVAIIAFAFADDSSSNSVLSVNRDSIDLEGMREKKDFASSEDGGISVNERGSVDFQDARGKPDSTPANVERGDPLLLLPENVVKRAPMGFQSTRGKKDSFDSDFGDAYIPNNAYGKRAYYKQDEHYKRAPMGFQGTRGKKSLQEIMNEIEKRNTVGFQDTRNPDAYSFDYSFDYETRVPSMAIGRFREDGSRDKNHEIPGEWEKRAPMGFQGMRGKKTILDVIEQLEKRALLAGFHGMRGKKDDPRFGNFLDYSIDPSEHAKRSIEFYKRDANDSPKRARMGFHGMRGTNDKDRGNGAATYEIAKRSPLGYVAVRGKKNPRWEFRGKFVGVRGKKSPSSQHRSVF